PPVPPHATAARASAAAEGPARPFRPALSRPEGPLTLPPFCAEPAVPRAAGSFAGARAVTAGGVRAASARRRLRQACHDAVSCFPRHSQPLLQSRYRTNTLGGFSRLPGLF